MSSSLTLETLMDAPVVVLFVSSQVDFLLLHPHFLFIVPLYVLLGRCSVILSRAGCLYDPRTEIWLARPECLSFFPLPLSSPLLLLLLLLCSGRHCHRSSLLPRLCCFFACLPHPFCSPPSKWVQEQPLLTLLFFHVKPCVSLKASLYFWISGYCFKQVFHVVWMMWWRSWWSNQESFNFLCEGCFTSCWDINEWII